VSGPTSELLDMLLSALTMPEYASLREGCERELRRRGVLTGPASVYLVELLFDQHNR
jgi:hypothetical protein